MIVDESKVSDLGLDVAGQLRLPSVSIRKQSLLVVEQLFMIDCGVLVVGALDNSIYGAGLLAEATVNALCHINIVASSSPRTIRAGLAFDGDSEGRAGSST